MQAKEILKLHRDGKSDEAEKEYRKLLEIQPEQCQLLFNIARLKQDTNNVPDALRYYGDAVLAPGFYPKVKGAALCNISALLWKLGHYDESRTAIEHAYAFDPERAETLSNRCMFQMYSGDIAAAKDSIEKSIRYDPNSASARWNHAIIQLLTGDLRRGWISARSRFKNPGFPTRPLNTVKPIWKGEQFDGKTLLLWHEQGIGDTFQFLRYAKLAKARSPTGTVKFVGPPECSELLGLVPGLDSYLKLINTETEEFDWHCPLMDLPRIFKTRLHNIPADIPYIDPPCEFDLPPTDKRRVGLVWAGRPEHGRDRWRTIPCAAFKPLLDVPGIQYVALQFGPALAEAAEFPQILLPGAKSWLDTAAILRQLDLLITVDTSVLHLAGAMGRRIWGLIPFSPDWRWMLGREDTPWYPTVKLLRQPKFEDWDSVIQRVKRELEANG